MRRFWWSGPSHGSRSHGSRTKRQDVEQTVGVVSAARIARVARSVRAVCAVHAAPHQREPKGGRAERDGIVAVCNAGVIIARLHVHLDLQAFD